MADKLFRSLKAAPFSAFGALCLAGVAELLLWQLVPPVPGQTLHCEPTALILALDRSGSMVELEDKLKLVKDATGRLVDRALVDPCVDSYRFGLVSFNREAVLDVAPTSDLNQVVTAVDAVVAEGGTIIESGISAAVSALQDESFNGWRKVVLLLTDAENYSSNSEGLRLSLEQALSDDIDVRAVVTEKGEHFNVLNDMLGPDKVTQTADASIGETFFQQAEGAVLSSSVLVPERQSSPFLSYLSTGVWTGLVTAGIAFALLAYLNRYYKRDRLLSRREALAVVFSLLLGLTVGVIVQYVFTLEVGALVTKEGRVPLLGYGRALLLWSSIGLLLSLGLAGFRVLPNVKLGYAGLFGFLGGLGAGMIYALVLHAFPTSNAGVLSRLTGATVLGGIISFALRLLTESGAQHPLWLQVYYTSDRVYRHHPLGSTPLTIGSSQKADIYVGGEHDILWQFWVDGRRVHVSNHVSNKTRALSFEEASQRGGIELKGLTLKIVDDEGKDREERELQATH